MRTIAAHSAARVGRHDLAAAHCRAALPVQREHDDLDGEANSVFTLGLVALGTGDARAAVTHFRAALELFHRQTNTYLQADLRWCCGDPTTTAFRTSIFTTTAFATTATTSRTGARKPPYRSDNPGEPPQRTPVTRRRKPPRRARAGHRAR
ncbi:tetratricopeptide repeat protein [Saccharothrix lopnurensis]|uniref:Tetratricopeptide repeat protein n=1 Tax=Saccharothrix lopnurensis TaxID=1670621 RepID=A0ABW1P1X2_9PSEU